MNELLKKYFEDKMSRYRVLTTFSENKKSKVFLVQDIESNAIYINGQQIPLAKNTLEQDDFIDGFCVLRRGKNANVLVELG